ncbi:unnamed protein product, partial [Polarella glacialis]
ALDAQRGRPSPAAAEVLRMLSAGKSLTAASSLARAAETEPMRTQKAPWWAAAAQQRLELEPKVGSSCVARSRGHHFGCSVGPLGALRRQRWPSSRRCRQLTGAP